MATLCHTAKTLKLLETETQRRRWSKLRTLDCRGAYVLGFVDYLFREDSGVERLSTVERAAIRKLRRWLVHLAAFSALRARTIGSWASASPT
jgi:hypothetical protein